jgi:hypothetical protein
VPIKHCVPIIPVIDIQKQNTGALQIICSQACSSSWPKSGEEHDCERADVTHEQVLNSLVLNAITTAKFNGNRMSKVGPEAHILPGVGSVGVNVEFVSDSA